MAATELRRPPPPEPCPSPHAAKCGSLRSKIPLDVRLLFAYHEDVPNCRCRVSFTDARGITHVANVTGESLYEVAVVALAEFRKCGFTDASAGPATRLRVAVESPSTEHEISVGKVCSWLDGNGRSPNEQALKVRLRQLLGTWHSEL